MRVRNIEHVIAAHNKGLLYTKKVQNWTGSYINSALGCKKDFIICCVIAANSPVHIEMFHVSVTRRITN